MNYELLWEIARIMLLAGFCIITALVYVVVVCDFIKTGLDGDKVRYPWAKEEKRAAKKAAKRARERKWYEWE